MYKCDSSDNSDSSDRSDRQDNDNKEVIMSTTCGNQIAKNLGNVTPRLMRPELAAAYVALNPGPFRNVPELAGLILPYFGTPAVDKMDLDALIDAEKKRLKNQPEGRSNG